MMLHLQRMMTSMYILPYIFFKMKKKIYKFLYVAIFLILILLGAFFGLTGLFEQWNMREMSQEIQASYRMDAGSGRCVGRGSRNRAFS